MARIGFRVRVGLECEMDRNEGLQKKGVKEGWVKKKIWLTTKTEYWVVKGLKRHLETIKSMTQV